MNHKDCYKLPSKHFGCTEHEHVHFADCLVALENKHQKSIKQWEQHLKIDTDGRVKKLDEQDDRMIYEWSKRRINKPNFSKAPDWTLLECGCPIYRLWTCIAALRKLERSKYPNCEGQEAWVEQTKPLLEMGWDEKSIMTLFHKELTELWHLYAKHAVIRPRWRISILETYIDHGDLILPPNWSANAMAAVSLLQYDRFTKILYLDAEFDPEERYASAKFHNGSAKHPEYEGYSPHRSHVHDVPYAYTFLFTRLRKQLKKTPLIYDIAVDMLADMIEHEGSGYRCVANINMFDEQQGMNAQDLVDATVQNLRDDESYQ